MSVDKGHRYSVDEFRARCRRAFEESCVPMLREAVAKGGRDSVRCAKILEKWERAKATGWWGGSSDDDQVIEGNKQASK